jgi:hypothetical protein
MALSELCQEKKEFTISKVNDYFFLDPECRMGQEKKLPQTCPPSYVGSRRGRKPACRQAGAQRKTQKTLFLLPENQGKKTSSPRITRIPRIGWGMCNVKGVV